MRETFWPYSMRYAECLALLRLLGFGASLLGAAACFGVAFLTLPLLPVNPGKFALAFRYVFVQTFACDAYEHSS